MFVTHWMYNWAHANFSSVWLYGGSRQWQDAFCFRIMIIKCPFLKHKHYFIRYVLYVFCSVKLYICFGLLVGKNTILCRMSLALLHADKRCTHDGSHRWAFFHCCIVWWRWRLLYVLASCQSTYSHFDVDWIGSSRQCRRILFPNIRKTATFSLPTFTWLIVTDVHGAAWCHLPALPSPSKTLYLHD